MSKIANIHDGTIHLTLHVEEDRETGEKYQLLSLWDREEQAKNIARRIGFHIPLKLTEEQLAEIMVASTWPDLY